MLDYRTNSRVVESHFKGGRCDYDIGVLVDTTVLRRCPSNNQSLGKRPTDPLESLPVLSGPISQRSIAMIRNSQGCQWLAGPVWIAENIAAFRVS
jgi:hypothetical protein